MIADGLANRCALDATISLPRRLKVARRGATAELGDVTDRAVEKAILTEADAEVVSAHEARIVCLRRAVSARC